MICKINNTDFDIQCSKIMRRYLDELVEAGFNIEITEDGEKAFIHVETMNDLLKIIGIVRTGLIIEPNENDDALDITIYDGYVE